MSISVVIPARNEERWLPVCLRALRLQPGGSDVEIIVVDHLSVDRTADVARSFGARVIRADGTIGAVRQAGVDASRGDIIASTDADTIVCDGWLRRIAGRFADDPDLIAVHGPIKMFSTRIRVTGNPLFEHGWSAFSMAQEAFGMPTFAGANFAVRREAMQRIGGFDTQLPSAEDADLARRLAPIGSIRFDDEMVVSTSARRLERQGYARFVRHHLTNYVSLHWRRMTLPFERVD